MQKESGLQGRIGMEGDGRITMNQGEVVTFETALKAAKSTGEITYDFDCEIEQNDGQISEGFQKKRDEEWCRKADVVALQTQLREVLKDLEEFNRVNEFLMVDRIIEDLKNLLGCVEAKEK